MMRSLKQLESDYDIYRLSVKEILVSAIEGILIIGIFGYFFYRSLFITILALPLIYFYILYKSVIIKQKRKSELRYQFKEILVSVSGSIRAGYSLENAFLEAEKDIISFYGKEALIANELSVLRTGLKNNKTITTLITDMSKRCEIQEMKEFADVLVIGKQTGGNLTDIIDSYIKIAEDKFQIMYNRCVLYQDCYIAALRGAQLAHEDKKKILSETELAIMKLLENQLYQYQKEPEVVVSDSMISVKASNRIDITVPQIIGGKNSNLISNREADSKIINPSTLIRNVY